ncbi:hypothetical protein AVEN_30013-1 [Araneus ventricosus]|uniref:Uncharacterized protein n=1 Tax=Araneus ventricosus TaxID=182803 RepID=A0A4Y2DY79_ARAVE|nr:hypothetical protein AVEN_30013-1 [Araneus ventricosus]
MEADAIRDREWRKDRERKSRWNEEVKSEVQRKIDEVEKKPMKDQGHRRAKISRESWKIIKQCHGKKTPSTKLQTTCWSQQEGGHVQRTRSASGRLADLGSTPESPCKGKLSVMKEEPS